MKTVLSLLSLFIFVFSFAQDNRSFEQINDSILHEAHLLTQYDNAFKMSMNAVENHKKLRKEAGEVLLMPKKDTLYSFILAKNNPELILAEMKLSLNVEDSIAMVIKNRETTKEELDFYNLKHKIMNSIQSDYNVNFGDKETYLNPIFIPFTDQIRGKEVQLYKMYLITETNQANTLPFGRDYLFYARADGKIFFNLQFNVYQPLFIDNSMVENAIVELEYNEREPYITPTDIYLFSKYGSSKGLNTLRVKSKVLDIIFQYEWDRDELYVVVEELSTEEEN